MGRPDPLLEMQLPPTTGAFVGRGAMLERLARAFAEGERLVTLFGPGGVGKTRLATELAWLLHDDPAERGDGVYFCDLADARDADEVGDTLGRALSLPLFLAGGDDPGAEIGRALGGRGRVLVVLDNFEQIASLAAETVGRWAQMAREARFLVTSRERLRLPSELAVEVEPLPVPAQRAEVEAVLASPAVQLFLARASRRKGAGPPQSPSADELRTIAQLVRRLEGLPLALELCAGRTGLLSPRQLLAEISRGLDRAGGGGRGRPSRHATLRAAISWSWDLLEPAEQRSLARLSVFRGGFDLRAAEAVLSPACDEPVSVVEALHDKSLLRVQEGAGHEGEARLSLYESVRLFSAEQLEQGGDRAEAERAHADFFARLGDELSLSLEAGDERGARARGALELENLVAASERSADEAPALAARAIVGLEASLTATARFDVAARLADRAVSAARSDGDRGLLARALRMRAEILRRRNLLEAENDLREALDLLFLSGNTLLEARLLGALGGVLREEGRYDESAGVLERALRLSSGRSPRDEAIARLGLSALCRRAGSLDEARTQAERALAQARALGDEHLEGRALLVLGLLDDDRGRLEPSLASIEAALDKLRASGDRWQEQLSLNAAGLLHDELGRPAEARACFDEALAICTELGLRAGAAVVTGNLGWVDLAAGHLDEAASRFHQAIALSDEVGHVVSMAQMRASLGAVEALRGRLEASQQAFAEASKRLGDAPSPSVHTAVETLRGLLDAALARAASARGDRAEAARHQAAARRRLEQARQAPERSQSGDLRMAVRALGRALGEGSAESEAAAPTWLKVSEGCLEVQVEGGDELDLSRHGTLRRVLAALVDAHQKAPGRPLDPAQLFEAGWPGEKIGLRSARNRVYVTLSKLRKMGLQGVLSSRDDGYLIAPQVKIETR